MLVRALDQQQRKRSRESTDPQVPGVWNKKKVREVPTANREGVAHKSDVQSNASSEAPRDHQGQGKVIYNN